MNIKEKTTMHQTAGGWVVVSWDETMQMGRESAPMSYYMARMHCGIDNCRRKSCTNPNHKMYHELRAAERAQ